MLATALPTPALSNSRPSVASICGSSAAQPMSSSSRLPSRTGTSGLTGRNSTSPSSTASTLPAPRPTRVAVPSASSGCPATRTRATRVANSAATTGMSSAGRNSRLPSRAARARR